MPETTAKIKALYSIEKNTGVTEDLARHLHDKPGGVVLGVIELRSVETHHKVGATAQKVDLEILNLEVADPVEDTEVQDHLRALMRSMHRLEQPALPGTASEVEPSVDEVMQNGTARLLTKDDDALVDA